MSLNGFTRHEFEIIPTIFLWRFSRSQVLASPHSISLSEKLSVHKKNVLEHYTFGCFLGARFWPRPPQYFFKRETIRSPLIPLRECFRALHIWTFSQSQVLASPPQYFFKRETVRSPLSKGEGCKRPMCSGVVLGVR